jgi:hypothetical protein
MTKNCKKLTAEKTTIYLSLGLHKVTEEAFRPQKGPSNTSKHELLQTFSTSVGHFALLDPDPDSESGSTDPIESGSNPDPDPQPWIDDGRR